MTTRTKKSSTTVATQPAVVDPEAVIADVAVAAPAPVVKAAAPKAAAPKAAEAPAFDMMKPFMIWQEQVRLQTEKGVSQAKDGYATLKDNAEVATAKLEESMVAARSGAKAFSETLLDIVRSQSEASLAHVHKLATAKTMSDVIAMQQAYLVAQMDAFKTQAGTLATVSTQVANDVAAPVKASFAATFKR